LNVILVSETILTNKTHNQRFF